MQDLNAAIASIVEQANVVVQTALDRFSASTFSERNARYKTWMVIWHASFFIQQGYFCNCLLLHAKEKNLQEMKNCFVLGRVHLAKIN